MCEPQRGDRRWLTPFANLLTRVIFSTKDRQPLLTPDLRTALLAYMGGIVRNFHGKLIDSYTWEQPLPPLPGLRKAADALAPTAHAVGYSLAALLA